MTQPGPGRLRRRLVERLIQNEGIIGLRKWPLERLPG